MEELKVILQTVAVATLIIGVMIAGAVLAPILISAGILFLIYVVIKILNTDPDED